MMSITESDTVPEKLLGRNRNILGSKIRAPLRSVSEETGAMFETGPHNKRISIKYQGASNKIGSLPPYFAHPDHR